MFDKLSLPVIVAPTAHPTEQWAVNFIAHKTKRRYRFRINPDKKVYLNYV